MIHRLPTSRRCLGITAVTCLAAALPLAAFAAGQDEAPAAPLAASPATIEAPAPPPLEGMVAVRDAETGELRAPTADELASLTESDALMRSDVGLEQVVLPDGTVMVDLQGRFQNLSLAVIGDDGRLHRVCTTGAAEAAALLTGAAAAHDHPVNDAPAVQEVRDDR